LVWITTSFVVKASNTRLSKSSQVISVESKKNLPQWIRKSLTNQASIALQRSKPVALHNTVRATVPSSRNGTKHRSQSKSTGVFQQLDESSFTPASKGTEQCFNVPAAGTI
jgi:hypothetical protein